MIRNKENNVSLFVKKRRKQLHLTQIEMAEKANVGLRFVRDLEQGKLSLRTDKVNDVLRLFGFEIGVVEINRDQLLQDV